MKGMIQPCVLKGLGDIAVTLKYLHCSGILLLEKNMILTRQVCIYLLSLMGSNVFNSINVFNAWKYQHYFEFDTVKGDRNNSVRFTLCVGRKLLSTAKNSISNLSKQLVSQHKNVKLRIPLQI